MIYDLKKAGFLKRVSALILDLILFSILATGFVWGVSLICGYSEESALYVRYYDEYQKYYDTYAKDLAEGYGYTYDEESKTITSSDGKSVSIEVVVQKLQDAHARGDELTPPLQEAYDKYKELTPVATVDKQYVHVQNMFFMMLSVGTLLAYVVLEFIVPICLKNGRTVGKLVFNLCLVRNDCVKIKTIALFTRTILGKYAIETMFPLLLLFLMRSGLLGSLGLILFVLLLIGNLALYIGTAAKTPIHDILAYTVVADMNQQMIFETEEEMLEKRKMLAESENNK